mmetsp:Transcript_20235/g.63966  ORF Transcript_20235/g.63966 Transcript_20235/m.63966 type:complete len:286 (+) Transcript_20235:611-1468(+)
MTTLRRPCAGMRQPAGCGLPRPPPSPVAPSPATAPSSRPAPPGPPPSSLCRCTPCAPRQRGMAKLSPSSTSACLRTRPRATGANALAWCSRPRWSSHPCQVGDSLPPRTSPANRMSRASRPSPRLQLPRRRTWPRRAWPQADAGTQPRLPCRALQELASRRRPTGARPWKTTCASRSATWSWRPCGPPRPAPGACAWHGPSTCSSSLGSACSSCSTHSPCRPSAARTSSDRACCSPSRRGRASSSALWSPCQQCSCLWPSTSSSPASPRKGGACWRACDDTVTDT